MTRLVRGAANSLLSAANNYAMRSISLVMKMARKQFSLTSTNFLPQ